MNKNITLALLLAILPTSICLGDSTTVTAGSVTNNDGGSGTHDGTASVIITVRADSWNELFRDFHLVPKADGAKWPPGTTLTPVTTVENPGGGAPLDSPVKDWTGQSPAPGQSFINALTLGTGTLPTDAGKGVDSSQGAVEVSFRLTCEGSAQSLSSHLQDFKWFCTNDGSGDIDRGSGGNIHDSGASDDNPGGTLQLPMVSAITGPTGPEINAYTAYGINYGVDPPDGLTYTVYVMKSRVNDSVGPGNLVDDADPLASSQGVFYSTNSISGTTVVSPGVVRATYMEDQRNVFTLDVPDKLSLVGTVLHIQVRFSDGTESTAFTVTIASSN